MFCRCSLFLCVPCLSAESGCTPDTRCRNWTSRRTSLDIRWWNLVRKVNLIIRNGLSDQVSCWAGQVPEHWMLGHLEHELRSLEQRDLQDASWNVTEYNTSCACHPLALSTYLFAFACLCWVFAWGYFCTAHFLLHFNCILVKVFSTLMFVWPLQLLSEDLGALCCEVVSIPRGLDVW